MFVCVQTFFPSKNDEFHNVDDHGKNVEKEIEIYDFYRFFFTVFGVIIIIITNYVEFRFVIINIFMTVFILLL